MSLFDLIVSQARGMFGLGDKADSLLAALLAFMTNRDRGGFNDFLNRFSSAGLGDVASSWIAAGESAPLSNEQIESSFTDEEIGEIAAEAGVDKPTATSGMAFMIPHVIDKLTPDGVIPEESSILSRVGSFLSGTGGSIEGAGVAAGVMATGAADRIGTAAGDTLDTGAAAVGKGFDVIDAGAGAVGAKAAGAFDRLDNTIDGDSNSSILNYLLPLLLLGLLVILGYWFCGRSSTPTVTVGNTNVNVISNRPAAANINTAAKAVDSSFSIKAADSKYTVTGVVPNEATRKQIMDALTAQYGAGNVNFDGLKVDAAARPFAAGWWNNFSKMLPSLKDWKTGELSFAGSAITAAGLPQAAIEQLKSLFSGWSMPSMSGTTTEAPRTLTEVSLPGGAKLQAYPGGIEDQLIKFVQSDEYKNGTAESLKEKWFDFDDLNFKFGTTELVPESKRQLDNIVAILKAFPNVKIKIGGYTDKKGDDAANKKLSDDRAKAVKAALEKAGVGAQVPEAEGYGEQYAKVPETAGDKEREADRKTSVRLLK